MLYKFEALVGGIFLVFNAFKLTPDLCCPFPAPYWRLAAAGVAPSVRPRKGFCALPASPGLLPALF